MQGQSAFGVDSASPYMQTQGTLSAGAMSMQKVRWAERIAVDPEIHHGEPCIRGTRLINLQLTL